MNPLVEFVLAATERGECKCGRCADVGDRPDPTGHTVDVEFFKVALREPAPTQERFRALTRDHAGIFDHFDPLDGRPYSYLAIGAWIGDQQLALRYMALGVLLKVFTLESPGTIMPFLPAEQRLELAGAGLVQVRTVQ